MTQANRFLAERIKQDIVENFPPTAEEVIDELNNKEEKHGKHKG